MDQTITFECSLAYAYTGVPPAENGWDLTCGTDGTFPTTTWPQCRIKCLAPAPETGYADPNANEGKYFDENAVITYQCETAGHVAGDTTSNEVRRNICRYVCTPKKNIT